MQGLRSAWILSAAVPAGAVLLAWTLGWPPLVGMLLAGALGLLVAWPFWRRAFVHSEQVRRELLTQIESLDVLGPSPGEPGPDADPLESVRRLKQRMAQRTARTERELGNLRAVLDAAATPLLATNASGEVLLCNRACEEFFARPAAAVIGMAIEELFTQSEVLGLHASALAGKARQGQVRMPAGPAGQRVYQVLTAPVSLRNGDGPEQVGVVVSLRDVTELAQAVQLKTDFVANASHELRTPLTSIKVAVDTLAEGAWSDDAMRARLTGMISSNVARLEDMVRDLLDLSRLESDQAPVQIELLSLRELAGALLEDFEPVLRERRLSLEVAVAPEVDRLRTDPKLLNLILKNLIDNASKFAYEGTAIRLEASRLTGADPMTPGVRIRVADQGVGIPISQQQRVFERFFQVDPARTGFAHRRGTGLGLAIVKHAVKALGGSISLESVWKQGTTMTVDIPSCVETQGSVTGA